MTSMFGGDRDPAKEVSPAQLPESIRSLVPPDDIETSPEYPELSFDGEVRQRAHRMRVTRAAQELIEAENRPPRDPLDLGTLAEVLARPTPESDRIEGLAPWEASTLITAQRKIGKTTLSGNLARCLITGAPFLDRFAVKRLDGNLAMLNYEVSGPQLARWLDDMGVDHDRVLLVNLRGRSNPLSDPESRAELTESLRAHNTEALIVDPFGRAFTGDNQNDAGQVTRFLMDLEAFTRSEVRALDLFLTNHAGWEGERSRGSTALEDWPDALWRIVKPNDDDDNSRYFSAFGRDVEVSEDELQFDPETRHLTLTGNGSRKQAKVEHEKITDREIILNLLNNRQHEFPDGMSGNDLKTLSGHKDAAFTAARESLVADGSIIQKPRKGRGGGVLYAIPETKKPKVADDIFPTPSEPSEPVSIETGSSSTSSVRQHSEAPTSSRSGK
ncbi:AAA family ATPase [Propionimicrobium sp. PCR01-08-3]|uniref:AAA family ATPase n=1 Tax=Propionimicrobium sp. PCR01-08-3 TaxID=3052086 RepID=UPI00255D000F|nr:AAA family ATPase [Propionimicrobium sp. PCR01-08-3]WIY81390.1 AAA family ATPase [Propionimicrobium sp. PCR01-08-3]